MKAFENINKFSAEKEGSSFAARIYNIAYHSLLDIQKRKESDRIDDENNISENIIPVSWQNKTIIAYGFKVTLNKDWGKVFYEFNENEPLEKGEYYIKDLIGCKLMQEDGRFLGDITNILTNSGSTDVICFEKDGKESMFPFVKDVFVDVDIIKKIIKVNKSRLSEIIV